MHDRNHLTQEYAKLEGMLRAISGTDMINNEEVQKALRYLLMSMRNLNATAERLERVLKINSITDGESKPQFCIVAR